MAFSALQPGYNGKTFGAGGFPLAGGDQGERPSEVK